MTSFNEVMRDAWRWYNAKNLDMYRECLLAAIERLKQNSTTEEKSNDTDREN